MRKRKSKDEGTEVEVAEIADPKPLEEDQEVFEEGDLQEEVEISGQPTTEESPETAVVRLNGELEDQREQYLRLAADFDNFRKRVEKQRSEIRQHAQVDVVRAFLDTLDDVARVTGLDTDGASAEDVIAGVQMVEKNLTRALESAGLVRLGSVDERFDPNDHEAVSTLPAPTEDKEDLIAAVFQVGYRFAGTLLRPARVQVFVTPVVEEATGDVE